MERGVAFEINGTGHFRPDDEAAGVSGGLAEGEIRQARQALVEEVAGPLGGFGHGGLDDHGLAVWRGHLCGGG